MLSALIRCATWLRQSGRFQGTAATHSNALASAVTTPAPVPACRLPKQSPDGPNRWCAGGRRTNRAILEDIEPRILYSADHPVALMAAATSLSQLATVTIGVEDSSRQLVFIDTRVQDSAVLFADIAAQASSGRDIEAIALDAKQDGISQISAALANLTDVSAIHIISHGSEGAFELGTSTIDSTTLLQRAGDIAAWGDHLASDADLMLYGCDVGAGTDGAALIHSLSHLTGAKVAASTDLTGNPALGGNWVMEASTGRIDVSSAIDAPGQAVWQGTLMAPVNQTPSFGTGGVGTATHDFDSASDQAHSVAVQPDGRSSWQGRPRSAAIPCLG